MNLALSTYFPTKKALKKRLNLSKNVMHHKTEHESNPTMVDQRKGYNLYIYSPY